MRSSLLLSSLLLDATCAFLPLSHHHRDNVQQWHSTHNLPLVPPVLQTETGSGLIVLSATNDEEEEEKRVNPYQDPNYPDLEFVDYSDPEYQVDQGLGDEFYDPKSTEEQIEEMRESRRLRNDEYQFETYYKEILKEGEEYKGEWTVYQSSKFIPGMEDDPVGMPRLAKMVINTASDDELKVVTCGKRIKLGDAIQGDFACDSDRLLHIEAIASDADVKKSPEQGRVEKALISTTYWPEQLSPRDFRGQQGIMCVGNAYTVCNALPLVKTDGAGERSIEGPFSEYRAEIGLQSDAMRFRVKFDYAVLPDDKTALPPLHLRSMIVCRETQGMWPRAKAYTSAAEAMTSEALFGPPGADGGLYDPPPVGSDEQAGQYMLLELEGRATVLFPYKMDQDPDTHPDSDGWVTSLDWTPGKYRFQVDRKTQNGKEMLGLRTLELTEVQSDDAATYRPRDGGSNMRQ